jgi:hypothetical protein
MRALPIAAAILFGFGCLGGDYNPDMSVPRDMTPPIYDLAGVDLYGAYNCSQLNACERACTTRSCVYLCRLKATPHAVDLEVALQDCFAQYCPTGTGQVCAPDTTGMISATCMMCIANTYVPNGQDCQSTQNPSECHQCVTQANACTADV